jgi:Uma2 family endonuclease
MHMVELKLGLRTVDLPYTVRIPHITDEQFDELVDEDTKAELFDGVMIVHSPASPIHNQIAAFVRDLMTRYVEERDLGRIYGPDDLIRIRRSRRFAPDIFFLVKDRVPDPIPEKQYVGSPDLAMEILSPSIRDYDLEEKRVAYQEAGIREIWLVDPEEQEVIVDRRRPKGYVTVTVTTGRIASRAVAGFWLEATWLWSQPMPRVSACLRRILEG